MASYRPQCKLVVQSPPIYLKNQDLFALLFGWISFVAQCSYYPIEKMSQTLWKFIWLFSCVNIFQQTSFRSKKISLCQYLVSTSFKKKTFNLETFLNKYSSSMPNHLHNQLSWLYHI